MMKLQNIFILLLISVGLSAFSTTNIQLLYGKFDGNSYIYDTKDRGKTTITLEHFTESEIGSVFMFVDYAIADNKFKYHDDTTDLYGEIAPRLSLSYLTDTSLSFLFVKDFYLAGEYNAGTLGNYRAYLYGVGVALNVYGFDNFGINLYVKKQNIGKDTVQLTSSYSTQFFNDKFSFNGYIDYTELDFTTQNQLLYMIYNSSQNQKLYTGIEVINYHEKPSATNFNTDINSNTVQLMLKYQW